MNINNNRKYDDQESIVDNEDFELRVEEETSKVEE